MTDMFENPPETIISVAGGIIIRFNENAQCDEVLILQRSKNDHWPLFMEIPRGKCDRGGVKGESIIECLKREVKEETGLDIIPLKFIDKFSYMAEAGKRKSIQHNYLCKMKDENQQVKLSKEHDSYMWVSSMGLVNLHVMPEIAKSISKVFNKEDSIYTVPIDKDIEQTIDEYLDMLGVDKQ
jgi:8-oxo-dGTP pyrophosphatase MutT (NUDIX family)